MVITRNSKLHYICFGDQVNPRFESLDRTEPKNTELPQLYITQCDSASDT